MAKLRNVSGEAREVPLLGNRVVEPDEVVDVDDELLDPEQYVWPESTWQVQVERKPAKGKAAASEPGGEG